MNTFLASLAILMALTIAPLAAGNSDSTSTPSAQHCVNDTDNDGKEQPSKCDDSDADGK
jgi:hypothetical protein